MTFTLPLTGTGRAHAKAILVGEHAVVYGAPALAIPIPELSVRATLEAAPAPAVASSLYRGPLADAPPRLAPLTAAVEAARHRLGLPPLSVTVLSTIPTARGLGSSAAVASAIVAAAADAAGVRLGPDERYALVQQSERAAHGAPSGIDARAVAADTAIRFSVVETPAPVVVTAPVAFVVADSGVRRSSADAVDRVRVLRQADRRAVDRIVAELGDIADPAAQALAAARADELGDLLERAHGLLRRLRVSTPRLDALVDAARRGGSPGAKLTGGGRGGCIVAVAPHPDGAARLVSVLRDAGAARVWTTVIGGDGPRTDATETPA
ncbi:mevalonate kinase [Microbacterium marinilacus]|uniref:mevalonate kinase n=1 Tax=Microbacterium marinilacus TaxID=415209 RepID=A0ABP7BHF3_9MICO|nr:mevalonate kinase [Microbacterium marinilacus]MBY0688879.1 mevalonate kinase [Microbacterium marinilacus]